MTDGDAPAAGPDTDAEPAEPDGGHDRPQTHTIRLELVDEPGQLLAALRPIADNGGNLLSIFHERGHITPRGRIPVEVDLECPPSRFEGILDALRTEGINVVEADAEQYGEHLTVLLVGDLVGTDLSDTVTRIEASPTATVADLSMSAPGGPAAEASARLRLATRAGEAEAVLELVRTLAEEKGLHAVEPLTEGR
ncbi:MAG: amino acid-binding protein [Haloferacaceae archaeon]|jgi:ACT domain-containing protein